MIASSLRTRAVSFAYLFGPPRFIRREDAYKIHGQVCQAIGCDDLSFQYLNPEAPIRGVQPFLLQFQRKEGRGAYTITLDNAGAQAPARLLLHYAWPPSPEDVNQTMEISSHAVFASLQGLGEWQKVMAEVRIRAQCDARAADSSQFVRETLLRIRPSWFEAFGEAPKNASIRVEVPAAYSQDPMGNPRRELTIEVLKEDRRSLYVELMSQWPQLPQVPPTSPDAELTLRPVDACPREYIEEAYDFLMARLKELEGET